MVIVVVIGVVTVTAVTVVFPSGSRRAEVERPLVGLWLLWA